MTVSNFVLNSNSSKQCIMKNNVENNRSKHIKRTIRIQGNVTVQ